MTDIPSTHYIDKRLEDVQKSFHNLIEMAQLVRQADLDALQDMQRDTDRRLHEANAFRHQLETERTSYLDKARYEERHDALTALINTRDDTLAERIARLEKAQTASDAIASSHELARRNIYGWAVVASGCASALVTLLFHLAGV